MNEFLNKEGAKRNGLSRTTLVVLILAAFTASGGGAAWQGIQNAGGIKRSAANCIIELQRLGLLSEQTAHEWANPLWGD